MTNFIVILFFFAGERGKMKFPLQYVTSSTNENECFISNIEEFKKELHVYPIKKIAL